LSKPAQNTAIPLGTPFVRSNDSVLPATAEPEKVSAGTPLLPRQPTPCDDVFPVSMLTSILPAALSSQPDAAGGPDAPTQYRRCRVSRWKPAGAVAPDVVICTTMSSTPL
jgi:hypothetical protein